MGGPGSGGHNKLEIAELNRRGTFRPGRHGAKAPQVEAQPAEGLRPGEVPFALGKRRALAGLTGVARRVASGLIDDFGNWDDSAIQSLRAYSRSCARIEVLEAAEQVDLAELRREIATNLSLLRALELGKG